MAVNGFQDKKVSQMIAISYKLMTFNEPATLLKELKIELKPSDIIIEKRRMVMMSEPEEYLDLFNSVNRILVGINSADFTSYVAVL